MGVQTSRWGEWLHERFGASACHDGSRAEQRIREYYLLGFAYLTLLGTCGSWWALAIYYAGPRPLSLSIALSVAYGIGLVATSYVCAGLRKKLAVAALGAVLPLLWWCGIAPRNDRDWESDVSRLPRIEIRGTRLTVKNLREFDYRSESDFTPRWSDRTYDLDDLAGLDIFLSYWGSPAIAHTILSWEFASAPPLAISIETRKSKGEGYSTVAGFFKQYELIYVAADERDVIRLRTQFRGESVYLYRTRLAPAEARALLLDYVAAMNRLNVEPRFYNALVHNCTTTIVMHARHVATARRPLDWRMLVNGYADSMLYERGLLDRRLPFDELRERSRIDEKARSAGGAEDFSRQIRVGLPDPRPREGER